MFAMVAKVDCSCDALSGALQQQGFTMNIQYIVAYAASVCPPCGSCIWETPWGVDLRDGTSLYVCMKGAVTSFIETELSFKPCEWYFPTRLTIVRSLLCLEMYI